MMTRSSNAQHALLRSLYAMVVESTPFRLYQLVGTAFTPSANVRISLVIAVMLGD